MSDGFFAILKITFSLSNFIELTQILYMKKHENNWTVEVKAAILETTELPSTDFYARYPYRV